MKQPRKLTTILAVALTSLATCLTAAATPPAAPTGLVSYNPGAYLTWSPNGASSYNVKRAFASGGPYDVIATGVTSSTYLDTTLSHRTTCYYVVSGMNADGESANSAEISVMPGGRPALGWNSWDFYGTSINEACTKTQADYMAAHLLSHGWNLITVDIQWYQPTATGFNYINGATLTMDAYGRLTPATNRFPSATGGLGFKPLADYVHSKGLTFGIHMMRGIPRQAVTQNTPILGTNYTANQIADTASTCSWNSDMYAVDMTKPGAQEYYDSIMALVASWEVDFVKIDDLSRPYHTGEIEGIRKAIAKTGRNIVLSTSPGATPVSMGSHVMYEANQWRISDDFWDNWTALYEQFLRLHNWTPYRGPGHFPDADMLPLGKVSGGSPTATGRWTNFTTNEQYTLMSLWAIARSPLIHGGDMTQMDSATLALLTNDEVLAVNQKSLHNRQLLRTNDLIAWTADAEDSADKYLAVFNATGSSANVPVALSGMGFTGSCSIRSLWDHADLGTYSGTFSPTVASHGAALYRITGTSAPIPWISSIVSGNNRVVLSWEAINSAASYSVKRSTSETGTYTTIASGLTGTSYTDLTAQNGTTYYYAVSAIINGQETINSPAFATLPAPAQGIVSWNYDNYGTVSGSNVAGVAPVPNWNNSYPSNPVTNLTDNVGGSTTLDLAYSSWGIWKILSGHPGVDANGTYNRELLNGYRNSGSANTPTTSSVTISQISFVSYDVYVYFSSDVADRTGTVTDGATTFSFKTIGSPSVSGSNAVLTRTTDTATGYPAANYAVFTALSGSTKTISCNIPNYGGIAGFQVVPRVAGLTISSGAAISGTTGVGYSQALTGTGGNPPYTWTLSSGALPPGLSLSSAGKINGTPVASGTFNFTVQLADIAASTATQSFSIVINPLAAPSGLSGTAADGQVGLVWNAVSGATGYKLRRSLTSGTNYSTVASALGATSFTDTGLTNGIRYYYVVSAGNVGGEGPNSSEISLAPSAIISTQEMQGPALMVSGSSATATVKSSVPGHTYQLQYRDDLATDQWHNIGTIQAGTGDDLQIVVPVDPALSRRFYRIQIQR